MLAKKENSLAPPESFSKQGKGGLPSHKKVFTRKEPREKKKKRVSPVASRRDSKGKGGASPDTRAPVWGKSVGPA